MAFKMKELNTDEYKIKIIKDLGTTPGGRSGRYALVECAECHKQFELRVGSTKAKNQTKCIDCVNSKHGLYAHPLYKIWNGIKQRCYLKTRKDYHNYGGKGVVMCDEWKETPTEFIKWCTDNGWNKDLVIDKDIKSRELGISPAIYSPRTISFITAQQNTEEALAKEVEQYTPEGKYITTFVSAVKAAQAVSSSVHAKTGIRNCCRGLYKTSFGFKWKYKN